MNTAFKNFSIFNKLLILVLFSIIPLFMIFIFFVIPNVSTKYNEDKNKSLKSVVESAFNILDNYNEKAKNGEITIETAKQQAIEEINKLRYDEKEYYFMYDLNGIVMALGSAPEKQGENRLNIKDHHGNEFIKKMIKISKKEGEGYVDYYYPKLGETEASQKRSYIKYYAPWNCFLGSGVYIDDISANITSFKESLYVPFLTAILIAVLIGFIIARAISKPLKELQKSAEKAANGDLNVKVEYKSNDEIGKLSKAFQVMVDNVNSQMIEIENKSNLAEKAMKESEKSKNEVEYQQNYLTENTNLLLEEMEKFSQGDLSVCLDVNRKEKLIKDLFEGFNKAVNNIKNTLGEVSETIHSTASAANQISSSAEEMANGAKEQSAQTGEVAAAIEEMSITIAETTKNVVETNNFAKDSKELATNGQLIIEDTISGMQKIEKVVKQASEIITELGKSSEQIGAIIQVINEIADQTNLLALNAAIEAARAGEQGRGFSVVADEVRKLAERTTSATNEIEDMIKKIQSDSRNAVEAIGRGNKEVANGMAGATKAGTSMLEIVNSSNKVLEISTQVAAASEEQSVAVEEISRSVEGINTITHEAAIGLEQIAGASTDLSQLAENLKNLISQFNFDNHELQHTSKMKNKHFEFSN